MRFKADLLLILVAFIWGLAFVAQRSAAPSVGIWWFNGTRFLLAALCLIPLIARGSMRKSSPSVPIRRSVFLRPDFGLVLLTSIVLALASGLQQAGLRYTTAANAGFITSLYVVLVPILSYFFFKHTMSRKVWVSAGLAVTGALFLSTGLKDFYFASGDLLEFVGAVFWALHLILVDQVVRRNIDVLKFVVVQYFIVSLFQFSLGLVYEPFSLDSLLGVWQAIAYTGLISVGLGYTLQAFAQRFAPPGDTAIILSMEAVIAALGGFVILGEDLLPVQLVGCALILFAVIWSQMSRGIIPEPA